MNWTLLQNLAKTVAQYAPRNLDDKWLIYRPLTNEAANEVHPDRKAALESPTTKSDTSLVVAPRALSLALSSLSDHWVDTSGKPHIEFVKIDFVSRTERTVTVMTTDGSYETFDQNASDFVIALWGGSGTSPAEK